MQLLIDFGLVELNFNDYTPDRSPEWKINIPKKDIKGLENYTKGQIKDFVYIVNVVLINKKR